ncbi:hypothetical protein LCGC14_0506570 [marine sediment metagenome]|uniref:RecA family profile 2 domain-containing protein n=1 Tax=marine sediment metagenome TaxID=412755 RepID=A0A0F9SKR4_9ZZZZ
MSIQDMIDALNESGSAKVTFLSDDDSPCIIHEVMSTGCLALDSILGGGLPVGRITEIYGDESTGKSLIAAHVAAEAQAKGHTVLYVDTESAVSIDVMKQLGVNVDTILYAVPDTLDGDDGVFQLIENAIIVKQETNPDGLLFVVWDSIAATSAKKEIENEYGKATYGRHALLISQGLRKLDKLISKDRVCALFLNQTRQRLDVMYGDKTATFGGKAVAFYSSIRVQLKHAKKIKEGKKIIGEDIIASVVKNKVAMPFRRATLPVYFGYGIDDAGAALLYLKDTDYMDVKSGGNYGLHISIGEVKFKKLTWDDVFDRYYDEIAQMILDDEIT